MQLCNYHHSQDIHKVYSLSKSSRCAKLIQLCPTLCDPMACSPPGYSVRGIPQARILEWVVISSFRESSWPRDWISLLHWKADSLPLAPPGKLKVPPLPFCSYSYRLTELHATTELSIHIHVPFLECFLYKWYYTEGTFLC